MTKNDLTESIKKDDKNFFAIVGPNCSGKSYFFRNELINGLDSNVFFYDERGNLFIKNDKRQVTIAGNNYIYINEKERGKRESYEIEEIKEDSKKIIDEIDLLSKKIDVVYKSYGTEKLLSIFSGLKKYNLNHINYFLFDEPESALDDNGLMYIQKIFDLLINAGKKVVFITHSPRLLEILQMEIDDIYLLPERGNDFINIKKTDVYLLFDEAGNEIINTNPDIKGDKFSRLEFLPNTEYRKVYLEELLKDAKFYRTLFYDEILIVEGLTEEAVSKVLMDKLPIGRCIFNAFGKYKILFINKLLSKLGKRICIFIDSDKLEDGGKTTYPYLLTNLIKSYDDGKECIVYAIPVDIESYLNIDKDNMLEELSNIKIKSRYKKSAKKFIKCNKEKIAIYALKNDENIKNKLIELFNAKNGEYEF